MAIAVLGLFGVGWYMVELTYYDALYKTLPDLHKSIGILVAAALVLRIIWRLANPTPQPEPGGHRYEQLASRFAHLALYLLMIVIVCSGYLISTADGSSISVFDWFEVSATVTSIPEQEDVAGRVHEYLAYALVALVTLHAVAALKHHFVNKDNTLRRMLGIGARNRPSPPEK